MKKTTTLILLSFFIITSCSTDIEINTPALQASVEGELFRTDFKKAVIKDDGRLMIIGHSGTETIRFYTATTKEGKYKLGQSNVESSFETMDSKFLSTAEESEGEIVITEISNNEITGTFYFKDLKDTEGNTKSFSNGWFYKVPIGDETPEDTPEVPNPCLTNATLTANVDGTPIETDTHSAESFGTDNSSILIKAANFKEEITIIFPINAIPGTYSLTGSGDYSATYEYKKDKASAVSGEITIISHDQETRCISGTFYFSTGGDTEITEGVFDFGY